MEYFKKVIECDIPEKMFLVLHKLMQFLELNGIDKGSIKNG